MRLYGGGGEDREKTVFFFQKYYIVTLTNYTFRNTQTKDRFAIYQWSGQRKNKEI